MENEFKFLKKLKHPNVIEVYDMWISRLWGRVYQVMEYFKGMEILEAISQERFSEKKAKNLFHQVLSGVSFLHESGVVHRDLKPGNILVDKSGSKIKITDFNAAKFFEKSKEGSAGRRPNYQMTTHTGTPAFSAPELFGSYFYSEMVDMWSAGCILYTMLCGYQPFQASCLEKLIQSIRKGAYEMEKEAWTGISKEAKDLVKKLLSTDPEKRPTPREALAHDWYEVTIFDV